MREQNGIEKKGDSYLEDLRKSEIVLLIVFLKKGKKRISFSNKTFSPLPKEIIFLREKGEKEEVFSFGREGRDKNPPIPGIKRKGRKFSKSLGKREREKEDSFFF